MADAVAANAAPAAAAPAGSPPAQAPVGEAALAKLPEKLQNLTRPVVVTGTVIGETPEGLTRVRTAVGEVQMQAPAALPVDKPVTLQIPAGSPPPKAMVLAQPPATAQAPAPATQAPAPASNQTGGAAQILLQTVANMAAAQPGQMPAVGSLISAVVLAANPRPTLTAQTTAAPGSAPGATSGVAAQPPTAAGKSDSAAAGKTAADGQAPNAPAVGGGGVGRGAAHGQPVELGGDAAHRGTMLDPPPAKPESGKPDGGKPESGKPGSGKPESGKPGSGKPGEAPSQQPSQQQAGAGGRATASPQTPPAQPPLLTQASPAPASAQTPTPTQPAPQGQPVLGQRTVAGSPSATQTPAAQTPSVQEPVRQAPSEQTPASGVRQPSVGLATREFAQPAAAPPPASTAPSSPSSPPAATAQAPAPAPPTTAPNATPQAAQPATQSTAQPTTSQPATQPAAPPPSLQAGQTLAFKVTAAIPPPAPGQPAPPPPPPGPPGPPGPIASPDGAALLEGEVAGLTPQGKPILALKDGMLALNTDLRPPPGTRLTLQLLDPAALALEKAAPAAAALPDYLQGRDWPALKMALAALRDLDPAMVQQFLAAAMPQPNRKLGAALTFLISAMRGGDARGWLGGDAARGLRQAGKEGLLQAMEQEFRNVERQTTEKLPDEWRGVALPFFDQTGINPLHLYFHPLPEPEKEDEKAGKGKATRFVLDVDLSKLGPLQLDGMVKPPQFDMILRSRTPLPAELRDELRVIFADCLAAVGYAGGLSFKADVRGWVNLARAGSAGPGVSA